MDLEIANSPLIPMVLVISLWALILGMGCYLAYFGLSLPFRRRERARMVLDLIERELKIGASLEQGLIAASNSRDPELGIQFHLFAAYLEQGCRLVEALEKTPRLLTPQITAMLKAGEEIGDIGKVLSACRGMLRDTHSTVQSAINYLVVMAFVITPIVPLISGLITMAVLPKYVEIFVDMEGTLPPVIEVFRRNSSIYSLLSIGLALFFYSLALLYLGGPVFRARLARLFSPLSDRLILSMPWKRKRMLRDFTALLSVLLDSHVPEPRAVQMAAATTGNAVFLNQADCALAEMRQGIRLPEVLGRFDSTGELRWRLKNVLQARGSFFAALTGWHEALEAKAYRLEQGVTQGLTTSLVLLNGLLVGSIAWVIFQTLISLINTNLLW